MDANGKLGKSLMTKAKSPSSSPVRVVKPDAKQCPTGKIFNPKTKRCVDINGKIGKELVLASSKGTTKEKKKEKETKIVKEKAVKEKETKSKKEKEKDIYDIIRETGDLIKNNIDPYDKLKLNIIALKEIKISDDALPSYVKYFTQLPNYASIDKDNRTYGGKPYSNFRTELIKTDNHIYGSYKGGHFAIVKQDKTNYDIGQPPHKEITYNLAFYKKGSYVTLLDLKKVLKQKGHVCDLYDDDNSNRIIQELREFVQYVFSIQLKLTANHHKLLMIPNYTDDLEKRVYESFTKPVPTIAKYGDQEYGASDPYYKSLLFKDILYVFWCNRGEDHSLKGYVPNAIFVVERTLIKVNYKYTNFLRLDYPSFGRLRKNDRFDITNISELIKEMRNIVMNTPFLLKFRGMSPYPKILLENETGDSKKRK